MRQLIGLTALLVGLGVGKAEAGDPSRATDPLWHRSVTLDYHIAPDGASTADETWEVRADTASVAHTIAQQTFSYVADLDEVELIDAYTRKASGERIQVASDAVLPEAVTTIAAAPQFSALTSRTIVFPSVTAGDTVHYEVRRRSRETLFPGQFTLTVEPGNWIMLERADISVSVPAGMELRVSASGLDEAAREPGEAGGTLRRWHRSAYPAGATTFDASSFPDYAALGRAYAARAWPQSQPGDTVRQLAQRLAQGGRNRREVAARLYQFVATDIRYVATFLGSRRVVPRNAETVLREGWGDCKDHAALLQALLAAEGIEAQPALISLRDLYELPEAPGLAALDHVLTYVPSLDLYLDSTAPHAPFGLLLANEYDKPVVLAHPSAAALARTPAMPQGAMVLTMRTHLRIGEDDSVSGRTITEASGPQGIALRSMAAWFEGRGNAYSARHQLQQLGTPGSGQFTFESPEKTEGEYQIEARFVLDDRLIESGTAPFSLPGGLGVLGPPGKGLLHTRETEAGGHVCYPGHETEEIEVELPAGASVRALPPTVQVHAGGASYSSQYATRDGVLRVRREFELDTRHQLCSQAEFLTMQAALMAARTDQRAQISLVRTEASRVAHGD